MQSMQFSSINRILMQIICIVYMLYMSGDISYAHASCQYRQDQMCPPGLKKLHTYKTLLINVRFSSLDMISHFQTQRNIRGIQGGCEATWQSLSRETASSTSRKASIGNTGPKTSLRMLSISGA